VQLLCFCITMLASYDPAEAQRLRQLLAADYGNGNELMMSVGSVMGTDDESMVTDANKNDVVCHKVHATQRLSQCAATSTPTCKHNACILSTQLCFSTQTCTFGFQRTAGNDSLSFCNLQVRVCSVFACFAQPSAYCTHIIFHCCCCLPISSQMPDMDDTLFAFLRTKAHKLTANNMLCRCGSILLKTVTQR